jgi:GT2 family glycosyltransferase
MTRNDPPLASILIPAHNCWELTQCCITSIRQHTKIPYEIVLIDDASDPDTARHMQSLIAEDLTLIRNENRLNYSANNNKAASEANGKYLCLLNNDTVVTAGWLEALVDFAEKHPCAGIVGNKHLFPADGSLHHCGMAVLESGEVQHLYPHSDPHAAKVNFPRPLQLVTFACVLIPATVYRELNGLNEAYHNGHEDCDFCLRARSAGYDVWYTPTSVIYHHGQASPGRKLQDNRNAALFLRQWGGKIEKDWSRIMHQDEEYAKEFRSKRSRKPNRDGWHFAIDLSQGSAFTWATAELIRHLIEKGADISVDPVRSIHHGIEKETRDLLRPLMKDAPNTGYHIKWSHYWSSFMKKPLSGDVNIEFFCTNYRLRPNAQPDAWLRHVQASHNYLLPTGRFNEMALEDINIEPHRMRILPLGYASEIDRLLPDGVSGSGDPNQLHLFVITNSHDLERYGTDLLIQACGRAYSKDDPVILHIKDYGVNSGNSLLLEWIANQPQFPRVQWHRDFLSRDDLVRLYARMDVLLAPFRGEGFGMKIIDAMAMGLPVMMPGFGGPIEFAPADTYIPIAYRETPVGSSYDRRHHHLSDGAYWCEVLVDDFVLQLQSLLSQRQKVMAVGQSGRNFVRPRYAWPAIAEQFMTITQAWKRARDARVMLRSTPSSLDCSVIIPTKDRHKILAKTLHQYVRQESAPQQWELLIVNDGGDVDALEAAVQPFRNRLPLTCMSNPGKSGPAGARNAAMERARGRIVVITGDDIIPDMHFLRSHMAMHDQYPEMETAVLGKTLWSNELAVTPFMEYLTGKGGHQFAYEDLTHGRIAPFDRFYTSNISLKRSFLIEEDNGFHTGFRYAAYEDIELAYRLHLRGMRLRYNEEAKGYHHHPMTPESFLKRQLLVGRMLTYLCFVQPSYVPDEHTIFLNALEYLRSQIAIQGQINLHGAMAEQLLESLTHNFQHHLDSLSILELCPDADRPKDHGLYASWLNEQLGTSWETVNELAIRCGMAKEWANGNQSLEQHAIAWIITLTMPTMLKKSAGSLYVYSLQTSSGNYLPSAAMSLAFQAYHLLYKVPALRPILLRLQRSRQANSIKSRMRPGS